MTIVYILAGILIFGVLIAVHELGHFIAAKLCGVQVNEFSIGMGPCVFHRQGGETQYSLRLFPIGGFCALEGEEEASDNPRAMNNQGFWKRLAIFAAGPFMNLLAGFLIILALYSGVSRFLVPEIAGAAPEFQARYGQALREGDEIYAVNGERVYVYSDVDLLMGLCRGKPLDLTVLRDGEKVELKGLEYDTYTSTDGETLYQGYGIYRVAGTVEGTLANKLRYSWLNTLDFARIVRLSLQMLFTGQAGMEDVSGPVGIVSTITQMGEESETTREAFENILYFGAMIAVNLAVMNMLPVPALDGGHIFFLVLDTVSLKVFRRKIPARYEAALSSACFMVLVGFMALVTYHDVLRLIR